MGGPTFMVHLPNPLSAEAREGIHAWLVRHTTADLKRVGIEWVFHFPYEEGCGCSIAIVPFGAGSNGDGTATEVYEDEEFFARYENALGYRPVESIQFDSFCGRTHAARDHPLLALFAAKIAREQDGVIDVDYGVEDVIKRNEVQVGKWYGLTWTDDPESQTYLVDADFMEAWVAHPKFFLVK